jgi:hypothetical protein
MQSGESERAVECTESRKEQRRGRRIARWAAVAWLVPFFAVCWAAIRVLGTPGRWKEKTLAVSISGNVLFVVALIMGYYIEEGDQRVDGEGVEVIVVPHLVRCPQGPLYFCGARSDSELAEVFPNTTYVASEGMVRARFEFLDERMERLTEVTLFDRYGRPWIEASLEDGTVIYSRYPTAQSVEPEVSLRDESADGIPDKMINWRLQRSFERAHETEWRALGPDET